MKGFLIIDGMRNVLEVPASDGTRMINALDHDRYRQMLQEVKRGCTIKEIDAVVREFIKRRNEYGQE